MSDDSHVLFHVHTLFTDGKSSVDDYASYASRMGYRQLVILEHIRRIPTYDIGSLVRESHIAAQRHAISVKVGFETKILSDGTLDISEEAVEHADYVGIAEHGALGSRAEFAPRILSGIRSARRLLDNHRIAVWVHPGLWLKRLGFDQDRCSEYLEAVSLASGVGIVLEENLRYGLATRDAVSYLRPKTIIGHDAHSVADFEAKDRCPESW